jgi:hypothetical protein
MDKIMYKKAFFYQIAIIVSFTILIFGCNYVIDPYGLNNIFDFNLEKEKIVSLMDRRLNKISKFIKNPKEIIILGDSRGDSLRSDFFYSKNINNMSYGGGTIFEAIDTFWFIVSKYHIKCAVFVIPFNLFDDNNSMNLVTQALSTIRNMTSYYFNFNTMKATIFILVNYIFNNNMMSEKPEVNKDIFWKQQLSNEVTGRFYAFRKKPINIIKKMEEIKKYCSNNNIKLIFISPPTHVDLQNKINQYNLNKEYILYKEYLKSTGILLDYDVANDITQNSENFNDPYHFSEGIARAIAKDVSVFF